MKFTWKSRSPFSQVAVIFSLPPSTLTTSIEWAYTENAGCKNRSCFWIYYQLSMAYPLIKSVKICRRIVFSAYQKRPVPRNLRWYYWHGSSKWRSLNSLSPSKCGPHNWIINRFGQPFFMWSITSNRRLVLAGDHLIFAGKSKLLIPDVAFWLNACLSFIYRTVPSAEFPRGNRRSHRSKQRGSNSFFSRPRI